MALKRMDQPFLCYSTSSVGFVFRVPFHPGSKSSHKERHHSWRPPIPLFSNKHAWVLCGGNDSLCPVSSVNLRCGPCGPCGPCDRSERLASGAGPNLRWFGAREVAHRQAGASDEGHLLQISWTQSAKSTPNWYAREQPKPTPYP